MPATMLIFTLQLEQALGDCNNWAFDAYALDEAALGRPLSCLAFWLMHRGGFIKQMTLDQVKLAR
jgi:hypothetical protein